MTPFLPWAESLVPETKGLPVSFCKTKVRLGPAETLEMLFSQLSQREDGLLGRQILGAAGGACPGWVCGSIFKILCKSQKKAPLLVSPCAAKCDSHF